MDAVEEIKSRLPIEDLVSRYVDLKRSGGSYKGLCPFHQEKSPSFIVTPSRGSFHCFGCGKGGDVFSFLMELERLPFAEALERLAGLAGVTLPERNQQKPSLKGKFLEANEAAAHFFESMLYEESGTRARNYLVERKFDSTAAKLFGLGYAPDGRDVLVQHLRTAGFDDGILVAAGLAVHDDIGGQTRDRFRGRLMFPIRDSAGRLVGFGGRTLGDAQPKYLNSPQTELFDKSSVLFGVHLAADPIRKAGRSVLVEGYLDAVRAHRCGFPDTVASLGTAVTVPQLTLFSRLSTRVVLALDPDPAGQAAAARTAITALAEVTRTRGRAAGEAGTVDLRIATLPVEEGDPDEMIRDHPDMWTASIDAAVPAFEFFFTQTMKGLDRSEDSWRQEAIDRLLPQIQQFAESAGWQATWLERLARETGLDPRALQRAMPTSGGIKQARRSPANAAAKDVVSDTTTRALTADARIGMEQSLLALLLRLVVVPDSITVQLRDLTLERPEYQQMLERVLAWSPSGNYDYQLLRETIPPGLQAQADELQARPIPLPEDDKLAVAVSLHVARLRRFRLQNQIDRVGQTLNDLAPDDYGAAMGAMRDLMSHLQAVEQELSRLSTQVMRAAADGTAG